MFRATVCPLCAGLLLALGFVGAHPVYAYQQADGRLVAGQVVDAATGETLPSATVRVVGTYVGTITNTEGAFSLVAPSGSRALRVRFVGYAPEEVALHADDADTTRLVVRLTASPAVLDEVVVTDENPAERIMRRVIAAKQRRNEALSTARADAYTRFTVRNDTGIVMMTESMTEAFWKRGEGVREIVKGQRVTQNMDIEQFIPAAIFVTNLYDDEVDAFGHTLRGVTHPDALGTYAFTLEGTQRLGESVVYAIGVRPRSKLASAFTGTIRVLSEADALLDVALSPGDAFLFPPPIKAVSVTFYQQFSDFDGGADAPWLPLDFRQQTALDVGAGALFRIPTIYLDQVSRLTGYRINEPVPDSLYASNDIARVDSAAVLENDAVRMDAAAVPLTEAERIAYASIDSTDTMEEAFEPSGPLARFVSLSNNNGNDRGERGGSGLDLGLWPAVWYDRVAGAHLGARIAPPLGPLTPRAEVGYTTGAGTVLYQLGGRLEIPGTPLFLDGSYAESFDRRYYNEIDRGRLTNSLAILFTGGSDGYDYYESHRLHIGAGIETRAMGQRVYAHVNVQQEDHTSLDKTTSYDLLGSGPLRENPPITEGRLGSVLLDVVVGERGLAFGGPVRPRAWLRTEVAREGFLGSAFGFIHVSGIASVRFPTLFSGRLQPNMLNLRVSAGYAPDTLPPQRFTLVETKGGALPGAPGIKTRATPLYEGDRHVTVSAQHDFRTVPFELIGWDWAVRKGWGIELHVAGGKTWLHEESRTALRFTPRESPGVFSEVGIGLGGLFDVLRVDVTTRLDESRLTVGVGFKSPF